MSPLWLQEPKTGVKLLWFTVFLGPYLHNTSLLETQFMPGTDNTSRRQKTTGGVLLTHAMACTMWHFRVQLQSSSQQEEKCFKCAGSALGSKNHTWKEPVQCTKLLVHNNNNFRFPIPPPFPPLPIPYFALNWRDVQPQIWEVLPPTYYKHLHTVASWENLAIWHHLHSPYTFWDPHKSFKGCTRELQKAQIHK